LLDYWTFWARELYTNSTAPEPSAARVDATFEKSAPDLRSCPRDGRPEVAFAGRSNAGKSSVLNAVTGNRRLARTSKTPGRTQLINCFATSEGGRLVDLPGYGFARVAKAERRNWQRQVERYLAERETLIAVVLVMDIRHPFEPFDRQLIEWARVARVRLHALLNKADKLGRARRNEALARALACAEGCACGELFSVQLFSATTGLGRDALVERLRGWLGGKGA
jgi:GTP-binding protein